MLGKKNGLTFGGREPILQGNYSPALMPVAGLYGRLFFCMSSPAAPSPRPKTPSIVYVDGFNFYYGAIKDTSHKWLNIHRF